MAISDYKAALVRGWGSSKGILLRIELLVLFCALLFAFTFVGGLYRRSSRSPLLKVLLWLANTLIYTVVAYTLGLMQSFPSKNEHFAVWAGFLLLVFLSSDAFLAYSLEDNKQWKTYYARCCLVSGLGLGFILGSAPKEFKVPVVLVYIHVLLKLGERIVAAQMATQKYGLPEDDEIVSDYMEHELEVGREGWLDPADMTGCPYLVKWDGGATLGTTSDYRWRIDRASPKVVTVGKVWQCNGKVLQKGERVKDVCLSFALFNLLKRRLSGYPLSESRHPNTRAFVFQGLVSTENAHERVFRILAVELSFLFDSFYTKYRIFFEMSYLHFFPSMLIFVPLIWLIPKIIKDYQNPDTQHRLNLTTHHGKNFDAVVTFVFLLVILIVEFMQLWNYMISDWAKVCFICKYIENLNPSRQNTTWCMEKFVGFFCRQKSWFRPWQSKISQYSLLDSFDHNPLNLLSRVTFGLVDKERQGQKQSPAISLPTEVKKAIIRSLRINNGQLTNGVSSLQRNGVSEMLSWGCQQETQTQTILIWHIATTLCEIAPVQQTREDEPNRHHRTVACSLSKYCAYLVAFAPELLPDHSYTTQKIFDMVVLQTRALLKGLESVLKGMESVESRYDFMMTWAEVNPDGRTITDKGSKLGKQLMEEIEDGRVRWKVLADFWAEMMIFVAPSDNATAHLEHLAQGGEFITHIWALLSHAGILARPEPTLEHV